MRISVECNGHKYYPSRCPCSGEVIVPGDDWFFCEDPDAGELPVKCLYVNDPLEEVDPPLNCPRRKTPLAMIVDGEVM